MKQINRIFNSKGNRESGIGNRESGIGNRESGIGNRESGIGNRESGNKIVSIIPDSVT
ncbi:MULTISPECIES: hypothetical protein [unclassified Moorena]|uniref:hypothetical protein n=1 Tax=unclassified Moorena TaxID=2683338 RepID=UPI001401A4C5|nr:MULTISPECIES: hypothetical protein [unclassified Moorena]NEO15105.1 hypothetical protein [Moorena sp. SIO3E8]NEQ01693.1 hypothetical protein [Moorena sp. SIO3F7]